MRYRWLSPVFLALASAAVLAQAPAQQPTPNAALDQVLAGWEQAMAGVTTLHVKVVRTEVDKTFQSTAVFSGEAKYLKPNKLSLLLFNSKKQAEYEKVVINGQTIYQWDLLKKEIGVVTLPVDKQGKIGNDNFVSMMFGMKAGTAKARYGLKLLSTDANYHYIHILPVDREDKAQFTQARLVLHRSNSLPREIWFEQPNGNEIKWDFPNTALNPSYITANDFNQPALEAGWQLKRIDPGNSPGAVRAQK
jgi:TIGR03009 family protein